MAWVDLPKGAPSFPLRGDTQAANIGFFERHLWSDPALAKNVCYIYPSASMADNRAALIRTVRGYTFNDTHMRRILSGCKTPVIVFVTKFEFRVPSWQLILIDRGRRTVELFWISGGRLTGRELEDAMSFLELNILRFFEPALQDRRRGAGIFLSAPRPLMSPPLRAPSSPLTPKPSPYPALDAIRHAQVRTSPAGGAGWKITPAPDVCATLGVAKDPFSCGLVSAAYLYLRLANPGRDTKSILDRIVAKCREPKPAGSPPGCSYLSDFGRALLSDGSPDGATGLPPFRNVPLADIDFTTYAKFRQTPTAQSLWLQHVAWELEKESAGRLICYRAADADDDPAETELMVVEPSVLQQYPTAIANRVSETLLSRIDKCQERFFIASLHIRYARDTPELVAEGRRNAGLPGLSPIETITHGHANILIFDIRSKRVFLFEPNGPPEDDEQERNAAWVERFVTQDVLPSLTSKYEFRSGAGSCPYIPGAQALQQSTGTGGYCVSWSSIFSTLLLLNPDWPVEAILQRMTTAGLAAPRVPWTRKERGLHLLQYIQRFTAAMDCVVPPNIESRSKAGIIRAMRADGLLPPLDCTIDPRKPSELAEILFFGSGSSPVLLGVRNTCGKWFTMGQPLLNFSNQASPTQIASSPGMFRRIDQNSSEGQRWLSFARRPFGTGTGTSLDPFVINGDGKSGQELVSGVAAAAAFSQAQTDVRTNSQRPGCPSIRLLPLSS
jgi:hypothetical protein